MLYDLVSNPWINWDARMKRWNKRKRIHNCFQHQWSLEWIDRHLWNEKKINVECIALIVQVWLMAIYRGMKMCYTHISEFWIIFRRKTFKRIIAYQEFSKLPLWFILSHVRVNAKLFSLMNSNNSTATVRKGCLQATIHCLRHFVRKFCTAFQFGMKSWQTNPLKLNIIIHTLELYAL